METLVENLFLPLRLSVMNHTALPTKASWVSVAGRWEEEREQGPGGRGTCYGEIVVGLCRNTTTKRCMVILDSRGCPVAEAGDSQLCNEDPAPERAELQGTPREVGERTKHPGCTPGKPDPRRRTLRPTEAPPLVGTGLPAPAPGPSPSPWTSCH